jgi:undecaprenyl-diphosphatase
MEKLRKIVIGFLIYSIVVIFMLLFSKTLLSVDKNLFLAINHISNPFLDRFFSFITYFGSSIFWLLIITIFWMKKKREISVRLLFAFIIDSIFLTFMKWSFLRIRPSQRFENIEVLGSEIGPSFPSGHSERVFSSSLILINYYNKLTLPLLLFAFLVSFSRIYIGVHYPLDVFVGMLNGLLVSIISLSLPTKKFQKILERIGRKISSRK